MGATERAKKTRLPPVSVRAGRTNVDSYLGRHGRRRTTSIR